MKNSMPDAVELKPEGKSPDFSIALGGPFYRILHRIHLSGDSLKLMRRRVFVLSLIAWLPLLLLSILEGHALGGSVSVPFLTDLEAHARFLLVLPLLIIAELVVHRRMHTVVQQFLERKLIPEDAIARFEEAIASASRLRNSTLAELLLIAFVYGVGILVIWRQYVALDVATWYAMPSANSTKLSFSGLWYGFVSLPLFQFLLCRWYYRLFIWTRFIWQVSRIRLNLVPTHPDRLGGLGFLSMTADALVVLAIAHGALLAGTLANKIFFLGTTLPEHRVEIAAMVLFVQCLILGPLLVFTPQIIAAKWKGVIEYGGLYARNVRELDSRWLRGGAQVADPLECINEIQTLSDLDGGYQVVKGMNIIPFSWRVMLFLAVATISPLLPLLLTMMPLEEILMKIVSILF